MTETQKEIAKTVFGGIDKDGSGFIDKEELYDALEQLFKECGFEEPDEGEVVNMMQGLDTDADGKLSFEEFFEFAKDLIAIAET